MTTREEIDDEIYRVVREAVEQGRDPKGAYREAFPGAPDGPYIMAMVDVDLAKEAAWYESMVRTIDGEIIRRASLEVSKQT